VPRGACGPPLTPSEQFAAEGGAQLLTAMAASHLPEVLRTIDGGAFAAEAPVRSVQLGVQELVCTHQRLVHLKWSPSGDEILKTWNVPWRRVKGVELQRDRRRVPTPSLLLTHSPTSPFGDGLRHRVLMLLFSTRELPADSGEPADAWHPPSRQVDRQRAERWSAPRPRVDKRLLARRRAGHIEVRLARTHTHPLA